MKKPFRRKILFSGFFDRLFLISFARYDAVCGRTQPTEVLPRWKSRFWGFQDKRLGKFCPVLTRPPNEALEHWNHAVFECLAGREDSARTLLM